MRIAARAFERFSTMRHSRGVNKSLRMVQDSIECVIDSFSGERTDSRNRVFNEFKEIYQTTKISFDNDPEKSDKNPWVNVLDLLDDTLYAMDDNSFYSVDIPQKNKIKMAVELLFATWSSIPEEYKNDLANQGILFEGYENVMPVDIVEGIFHSHKPIDLKATIINQHLARLSGFRDVTLQDLCETLHQQP